MSNNNLLGINIKHLSKQQTLEEIKKYIRSGREFCHIVSLNPENLVVAQHNARFKKVIETARITIPDGIGVIAAARMLHLPIGERLTGVGLMEELMEVAGKMRLRVLLIGGQPNLALNIVKCQKDKYPEASFKGVMGIRDINNPTDEEEMRINSIVRQYKPYIILAAFGSPMQELWLDRHSKEFKGMVCMGVGQGFDIMGRVVKRAPVWMQAIGFEWLYRLITQPWRWKRQLRLIEFILLVLLQKIKAIWVRV